MQMGPSHHPVARMSGVWSLRGHEDFPADCPHRTHCHCRTSATSSAGYTEFPAYSRMRTAPLPIRGAAISTLGPFMLVTTSSWRRLTHFWSALMVAHEIGLSHLTSQVRW